MLEIYFDQLEEASRAFNTANASFTRSAERPAEQVTQAGDALAGEHQAALRGLEAILTTGLTSFSQVHMATQRIYADFKEADQASAS